MYQAPLQSHTGFLRLSTVLQLIPISKSTWWKGVQTGRFPKPIKLGTRVSAWRVTDIQQLIQTYHKQGEIDVRKRDINEDRRGK